MYKNSALLTISVVLFLSLFCADGGYAFQIVNRPPPVDLLTIAETNGWTEGPVQIVSILFTVGLSVLLGLGLRRMQHHRYGHQT
jgi:hypothetical protein